ERQAEPDRDSMAHFNPHTAPLQVHSYRLRCARPIVLRLDAVGVAKDYIAGSGRSRVAPSRIGDAALSDSNPKECPPAERPRPEEFRLTRRALLVGGVAAGVSSAMGGAK